MPSIVGQPAAYLKLPSVTRPAIWNVPSLLLWNGKPLRSPFRRKLMSLALPPSKAPSSQANAVLSMNGM